MIYNVHAGHSLLCRGASGLLDEVKEDRIVKDKLITYLRTLGHTVYDCTDDIGSTQKMNLNFIVNKCNAHDVDLDISIHLNAGRKDNAGDGKTGGVEILGYDMGVFAIANKICSEIANTLQINNRGFKINKDLYVLNSTKAKAILIECCFVDDMDDKWNWDADLCAKAITKALTGVDLITENKSTVSVENQYDFIPCEIAGESSKMYTFEITKDTIVRVSPNTKSTKVATLHSGCKQGIDKVTVDGWLHIANNAGWFKVDGNITALNAKDYIVKNSHSIVRQKATKQSNQVIDLKKGSKQPICFITDDNWGLISNFAGWCNLKYFKEI